MGGNKRFESVSRVLGKERRMHTVSLPYGNLGVKLSARMVARAATEEARRTPAKTYFANDENFADIMFPVRKRGWDSGRRRVE